MRTVSFFDLEIDPSKNSILDVGCIRWDGSVFHENSIQKFIEFIKDSEFIAGHNVFKHDLKYIHQSLGETSFGALKTIDTLYLSPLLFPSKPYHHLLKDDKLQIDELNNPLNDSIKAKHLFDDEVSAFQKLGEELKKINVSH
jgi:ATP-dependent DNA helicase RecQ